MHTQESRMKDIQNQTDHRRINIKKVGVKTISYPVTVLDKAKNRQNTIATVNMYVNLPHRFKGTHMSVSSRSSTSFTGEIGMKSFHQIMARMKGAARCRGLAPRDDLPLFSGQGTEARFAQPLSLSLFVHRLLRAGSRSAAEGRDTGDPAADQAQNKRAAPIDGTVGQGRG